MNKLLTKIVGIALGATMAIGVGVAVSGVSSSKQAEQVFAAEDETHTFTSSSSGVTGTWFSSKSLNNSAALGSLSTTPSYTVKKVSVNTRTNNNNSKVTVSVSVGGTSWGSKALTSNRTLDTEFTGTTASGEVVITFTNNSGSGTGKGSLWVNSFTLTEGGVVSSSYTLTYNGNGNTDGSVPASATEYDAGTQMTVLGNTGNLVKVVDDVNYVFNGWNTASDGSGTAYVAGDHFNLNSDTTLYAQWLNPNSVVVLPSDLTDMSTTAGEISATYSGITFAISNGVRDSGNDHVRVYQNATLTITSARKMESIQFFGTSDKPISNMSLTTGDGELTTSGDNGTWEGEDTELVFTADTAQTRIKKFIILLENQTPISSLSMDVSHSMYEGQSWTPTITYSAGATVQTSEIVVVSGGDYVTITGGTILAKTGVMSGNSVEVVVKAHATDVENSTVYSDPCTITINKNSVTAVVVTTNPTKTEYVEGQTLVLTGMVLTVTWQVGETTISSGYEGVTTTPSLSTQLTIADHNDIEVLVSFGGQTTAATKGFTISVIAKAVIAGGLTWKNQKSSYADGETLVADGTLTIEFNDGSKLIDQSVATLYENEEVSFKLGGTDVVPGTTVVTSSDNNKSLTLYYGGRSTSVKLTVQRGYVFLQKCSSLSDLNDGEQYVIAVHYEENSQRKVALMPSQVTGKPTAALNADAWIDNDLGSVETMKADLRDYGWTLGASSSNWTLTNVSGNKLGWSSGTDFAKDGNNTDWTISVPGNGFGTFKVLNTSTAEASTKRVLAYRDTGVFGSYSASNVDGSSYFNVEFYKIIDPTFTKLSITCDGEGNNSADWSELSTSFSGLSNIAKAYYRHASYSVSGSGISTNVSATKGTDLDIARFISKYDYILANYIGKTDFIGRTDNPYNLFGARVTNIAISKSNATITIIVIISLIGIASIGGYFFLRKRKEVK